MDFRKLKRLCRELDAERDRISEAMSKKYQRKILVNFTSDGLCVMFDDQNMTGVGLEEFEEMAKEKDFDIWSVQTVL